MFVIVNSDKVSERDRQKVKDIADVG